MKGTISMLVATVIINPTSCFRDYKWILLWLCYIHTNSRKKSLFLKGPLWWPLKKNRTLPLFFNCCTPPIKDPSLRQINFLHFVFGRNVVPSPYPTHTNPRTALLHPRDIPFLPSFRQQIRAINTDQSLVNGSDAPRVARATHLPLYYNLIERRKNVDSPKRHALSTCGWRIERRSRMKVTKNYW